MNNLELQEINCGDYIHYKNVRFRVYKKKDYSHMPPFVNFSLERNISDIVLESVNSRISPGIFFSMIKSDKNLPELFSTGGLVKSLVAGKIVRNKKDPLLQAGESYNNPTYVIVQAIVKPLEEVLEVSNWQQRSWKRISVTSISISGWIQYQAVEEYSNG